MSHLLSRPMVELARLLGEGEIKARDLAEEAIANHERVGGTLMAYSQWAPDHARQCAAAADAAFAIGARAGSLQGLPTSIKDLFAHSGFPTYAGSPKRLPAKFEMDGPVVANLRRQLAVVTGKTHMVEFAFGGTGHNAHYGAPRNPWDPKTHRSPGGSSSGAGVSLCEGSALLAFGTDTAASVRLPAAFTGNAGLKFTKDRWSSEGIVTLSHTFDTPGILARRMEDAAFSFAALDQLARAGAIVKEVSFPEAEQAYAVFCEGGVSAIELRAFLDHELPDWLATIDPVNAPPLKAAGAIPARDYLLRLWRLKAAAKAARARFDDVDVIACPTVQLTPPVMAAPTPETFWAQNRGIVHNLVPGNFLTLCAATLPVGLDRFGMPVGLQLIAKGGDDEHMVRVACAAERVLGTPHERLGTPPMCQ
jgi:aspartyl-tRNA(Asn)/glutamyl-tRNA(Gln) amidotransferase subunit A